MVTIGNGSGTTTCPECGNEMGMTTWVGEKPVCAKCSGATTTGYSDLGTGIDFDESECLHDSLDENETHMISCPCPKCSPRC